MSLPSRKPSNLPPRPDLTDLEIAVRALQHARLAIRWVELRKEFLILSNGLTKRRASAGFLPPSRLACGVQSPWTVRRGLSRAPQRRLTP